MKFCIRKRKIIITEWDKNDPLAPSPLPENLDDLKSWMETECVKQMAREAQRMAPPAPIEEVG